jgi:pectate lyase
MLPMLVMLLSMEGMFRRKGFGTITDHILIRTTGGSGGTQTTVSTLDALTAAVTGSGKKIVLISGTYFSCF